jgi:hypothetical protein
MEWEQDIERKKRGGGTRLFISVLHQITRKQVKIGANILKMKFQIPTICTLYAVYEFYSALRGKNYVTEIREDELTKWHKNMWSLMKRFAIRCRTRYY